MVKMQLLSTVEKSHSTLCSNTSVSAVGSSNNDYYNSDSESEFSYNECDVTLVDDLENEKHDPKNDAEKMFFQVMEVLRFEQEVI
jgi:hypothetical protein